MDTIWKFDIPAKDRFTLEIPSKAKILCVQMQRGMPCLWAVLDTERPSTTRRFRIFGTGKEIDSLEYLEYIGTFQTEDQLYVWHLFEEI